MLGEYVATLDRLELDGFVYPAIQMPPPDETMPQDGRVSEGPHSATSLVNMIGVPAVVVPAGFYPSGLPFGLEFSGRPWTDGDLLCVTRAWEQRAAGGNHRCSWIAGSWLSIGRGTIHAMKVAYAIAQRRSIKQFRTGLLPARRSKRSSTPRCSRPIITSPSRGASTSSAPSRAVGDFSSVDALHWRP